MSNEKNFRCPTCGSDKTYETEDKTISGNPRYRCKVCKQRFTEKTRLKDGQKPEFTVVFDDDGLGITIASTKVMSLDELISRFKVDMDMWEVESQTINKWDVTAFGTKRGKHPGEVIKVPYPAENFQIKARLVKKVNIKEWGKFKKDFIKSVKKESPVVHKIKRKKIKSNYDKHLFEPSLYDLHFGKLGWNPETRDGHYDYKIAWERGEALVDDLIMKASAFNIERILLPWGHDFFNSDHESVGEASTNAGTPQQNEGRWQKMWTMGRKFTIMIVEKLKVIAPVDIVIVPGNHDTQKMFYLGDLLEVKYENDRNVNVQNDPALRKYYRYGNTLLGLTHQVGGKNAPTEGRLLQMMPNERESRFDFADTQFHEWHVGHLHHSKKDSQPNYKDHQGIAIRYMRSPSGADAWHANSGYTGAVKGAEAFIHNFETGLAAAYTSNIII